MIALTSIPAVVLDSGVSPELLSLLVATDAPVIFTFRRVEGYVDTAADQAGKTRITLEAGHQIVDGDRIGIFDAGLNIMVTGTADEVSTNVFDTDITWVPRYATDLDYVLTYTQRQNYYTEARIKLNGIFQPETLRATANQLGITEVDVSPFLRSAVDTEKVGDYSENSAVEANQSGEFEIEYRERYTGDENDYTPEGNTWYYVHAMRSREQGVNLHEYLAHGDRKGKFFNEFEIPVWTIGMPLDIQFFWPPWYNNLKAVIQQLDGANNVLDTTNFPLDDSAKGRLCSVKVNLDSYHELLRKIRLNIDEG